jgi:hypothetical protein
MQARLLELYPPNTVYGKGLADELDVTSLRHRRIVWSPALTDPQRRTLIRVLTGQVMNFKLIHRYTSGRIPPLCPLCRKLDSTSHIACGGCDHPAMKARVIKRHDNAVRLVLAAVLKGRLGHHAIVADVLVNDDTDVGLSDIDHGGVAIPRRLPAHLMALVRNRIRAALVAFPGGIIPDEVTTADASICRLAFRKFRHSDEEFDAFRARFRVADVVLRPDLVIFEGGRPASSTFWNRSNWQGYTSSGAPASRRIHIVEFGYVREGFVRAKWADKCVQHALLEFVLADIGWHVSSYTFTLGVTGTVYCDAPVCLPLLGLSAGAVNSVLSACVVMSLNHTHGLVCQRRQLDSHLIRAAFHKPP